MEISFEHPMMREIYMRKKDDYILMRDMEHMLIELVSALEDDINVHWKWTGLSHSYPKFE